MEASALIKHVSDRKMFSFSVILILTYNLIMKKRHFSQGSENKSKTWSELVFHLMSNQLPLTSRTQICPSALGKTRTILCTT